MSLFHTASELQMGANPEYYKGTGPAIYSDFSTYAERGPELARACANYILKDGERDDWVGNGLLVGEIGIGDGSFCIDFLKEARKIAKKVKITYHAFDISEKMLAELKGKNKKRGFDIETHLFDAANSKSIDFDLDFCILNELITDLPTEMVCKKNGEMHEVLFTKDLKETRLKKVDKKSDFESDLPEGYFVPLNVVGVGLLKSLSERCRRISVFDYGFDSFYLPPELWNLNALREYGGQVTADLNFSFVMKELKACGHSLKVSLEKQKNFIEKYGNDKKPGKNKKDIVEDDFFYHLSVSR